MIYIPLFLDLDSVIIIHWNNRLPEPISVDLENALSFSDLNNIEYQKYPFVFRVFGYLS